MVITFGTAVFMVISLILLIICMILIADKRVMKKEYEILNTLHSNQRFKIGDLEEKIREIENLPKYTTHSFDGVKNDPKAR